MSESSDTGLAMCYRHPGRETGVRCTRCDRPICPECMTPASVGFQCPECVTEGSKSVRQPKTVYGGSLRRGGVDATRVLIGLNVIAFILTAVNGAGIVSGNGTSSAFDRFALRPTDVANGDWYRLVSSMFLHFGLLHIAFNMWALLVIGTPLEQMLGRLRYLALYLLSGLGGGLLSMAFGPLDETAAGASGAIFGLFGAYYVITRQRGLETGPIVGLIAINLVFSFTFSGIDWRGHVGGLIVGAAVAFAYSAARPGPRRSQMQAAGCVIIAVLLVASGLGSAQHIKNECKTALQAFPPSARIVGACQNAGLPVR